MDTALIKSIQKAVGVAQDGQIGPITLRAIAAKLSVLPTESAADKLVRIAETQLGIFETSKNQGAGIEKYWAATSYPDGYKNREPYCAAFMCWAIREAGIFSEAMCPKTAAAFGFEDWAKKAGVKLVKKPASVKRGDIVVFSFSHIGLATSDSDSKGNFSTIEANTGSAGERDGDGVYRKIRNLSMARSSASLA